jgi:DNA-binding transcriptional LysR family regulator
MPSNTRKEAPDLAGLDLNKLRTFGAIADAGGVAAAARRLHLTRSAVSHSLASLEAALDTPLFLRVGRKLVLTDEGRALARVWEEVAERLSGAVEELSARREQVRGTVSLGVYLGFSRLRLAGVVERFVSEHPDATVRLVYHQSQADLVDLLLAGRLDMSLALRPGREASSQLASVKLFEQTLVLAARARPRARRLDFATIAALPVIDYFRSEPLIDRWVGHHYPGERFPRRGVRIWAASSDLALELALRGVGACVLPEDLVEPHRRRGDLVVLRGSGRPLRDSVWLNGLPGRRGALVKRRFREALAAGLG